MTANLKDWEGRESWLFSDGAAHQTLSTAIAGEVNPESATLGFLRAIPYAKLTQVDASGGDVTDQVISEDPAILLGWYLTAGSSDTLIFKNDTTTVFSVTAGSGDDAAGIIPAGIGLEFDTSLTCSLTTVGVAWVFWWPL